MRSKSYILFILFSLVVIGSNAQNTKALKSTGNAYFEKERYAEAMNFFTQYYEREKNDLDAILKLGICFYETGKLDQSRQLLDYYLSNQKNPESAVYLYLAKAHHAQDNFREAARQYKQFIVNIKENHPDRSWAKEAIIRCGAGLKMQAIDKLAYVENLGRKVNSPAHDFRPVLSPNYDDKIYFSSTREGSVGGRRDAEGLKDDKYGTYKSDMYSSRILNGEWTATSPFNSLLNSARNEVVLDFNDDGQVMFYFKGGNLSSGDILVDTFRANEEERTLFSDPFIGPMNGQYGDGSPHFYNDTTLIFASRRAGGFGGSDLYYSIYSNGSWTKPVNFGPTINTAFDETAPYLTLNGRSLYFSSNCRKSVGGFDIFKSVFDESKLEWEQAVNVGLPINSSEDDMDLRMSRDGLKAYFTSGRKAGSGGLDLYAAYFKSVQADQEIFSDLRTFHDVILDKKARLASGLDGGPGSDQWPGYDVADIEVFEMTPLYYESDDQVMTPTNMQKLDQVVNILQKYPDVKVELTSNSDETGPSLFDLYFSIKRVEEVGDFLATRGAKPNQIVLKGCGSQYGVANNYLNGQPSLIGQRLNRRIDIKFHNTEEFPVKVDITRPDVSELLYVDDWDYYQKMIGGLSYKVQIAATRQMYNDNNTLSRFSDVIIETTQDSDFYKYTVGLYKTFASANELKKELERLGVVGAFVVPYINGIRTTDDDAKIMAASYPDLLNFIASKVQD
ncbi:MAG: tetratricopeptide repeat protein [Bacteroidota bacterium]